MKQAAPARSLKRYFAGLSANTFLLALSSLFGDTATEMLYPVLPIFLTQTLGASALIVGLIDGIAQAVQNVAQGVSGFLADRFHRRKPLALGGYSVAAVSKPLIGLATSWVGVLLARVLDRLGAGTRSAPRDALIAESAPEADRGRAFGLEGFGDNFGAFLGPLVTMALLAAFQLKLRTIFFLALIPGTAAALMIVLVKEESAGAQSRARGTPIQRAAPNRLPASYWKYLAAIALFGLGNSSNAFFILRIKGLGASLPLTIFAYALFNLIAALASYPAGALSDRLGRRRLLAFAFLISLSVYTGFSFARDVVLIGALFVLYGVFQGFFRAVGKAFATDFVPAPLRATAIGWYSTTIGLTGLVASVAGGALWTRVGPPATFLLGAASALAGGVALLTIVPRRITP